MDRRITDGSAGPPALARTPSLGGRGVNTDTTRRAEPASQSCLGHVCAGQRAAWAVILTPWPLAGWAPGSFVQLCAASSGDPSEHSLAGGWFPRVFVTRLCRQQEGSRCRSSL